jgi:outer membrane protein W
MKHLLMLALAISTVICASAQEQTFKKFKVDLALGYGIPAGSGAKGGIVIATEPKFAINDNIAVGLRMETALMARATSTSSTGEVMEAEVKGSGSYLATGDYYLNTNSLRPFAGLGVGLFRNASANTASSTDPAVSTKFGFAPRAGFETGHFRAAIEYNVAGKSGTVNNNYLSFKIGFFLGGGRL